MKLSCLIAIAVIFITLYFIFKFFYESFKIAKNPHKYIKRYDDYKRGF